MKTITATEFSSILDSDKNINILDVRTDIECRSIRLNGNFIHIPLQKLNAAEFIARYKETLNGKPLYILCRSGGRASKAASALSPTIDVIVVEGGLDACCACDVPVVKDNVISLERQVRIAAGTLVLLGVLLGTYVHSGFYGVSGFVGAGLVFAGITNWCGMALLLARAPWNTNKGA